VPFPIRLEPSKRARLEVLAKADRRSLSNYILKVLYDHIDAIGTSRDKPGKWPRDVAASILLPHLRAIAKRTLIQTRIPCSDVVRGAG
jgi:hypothetical protein